MIRFDKLLGETPKAFLLLFRDGERWVPKSQCKRFITNKKLGGNVILPTFIINDIVGHDINEKGFDETLITPDWVVEHHTPDRVEPKENNTIKRLKK
ncbi:hypothetical protein [Flavobacterium sp. UMI-01]|uniref:hypothetical protein n=1 Tax=Flavobacterium sp. UMI-01 TaxID=1441053 RepID=UPI001C7CAC84|nr:hypothetical protein [Flavobacterium sp. UMI-01]